MTDDDFLQEVNGSHEGYYAQNALGERTSATAGERRLSRTRCEAFFSGFTTDSRERLNSSLYAGLRRWQPWKQYPGNDTLAFSDAVYYAYMSACKHEDMIPC